MVPLVQFLWCALYIANCSLPPASWGFYTPCLITMFGAQIVRIGAEMSHIGGTGHNFIGIQIHTHTYIPHIIRYVELN